MAMRTPSNGTQLVAVPSVLVVGDFRKNSIGFARKAWKRILEIYKREGESFGPPPPLVDDSAPKSYDEQPITITKFTERRLSPALFPIAVNDYGHASSSHFKFYLYQIIRRFNVVGVLSCCTAANNKGLAHALMPVDIPILLVLDSTLSAPQNFRRHRDDLPARSRNLQVRIPTGVEPTNVLQLLANNSLQAQAILAQVEKLSGDSPKQTVQFFCYPDDDEYVRDLKNCIQSNLKDRERTRIVARFVNDPLELIQNAAGILVCVGYYMTLGQIRSQLQDSGLILSDGFDDPRVKKRLTGVVTSYYLVKPVQKALDHAVYGYNVLNEEWRSSINADESNTSFGLRDSLSSIRELLQTRYGYRFVGSTNQRGGYFIEETLTKGET
jgi:hypothetical protein